MEQAQLSTVAYSGFPVRSLTKKLNRDAGEWVTVYRVDQRKRFKTTMSRALRDGSQVMRPPTNTREVSGALSSRAPTLNRDFLLQHCFVKDPNDLSVANISGASLERCIPEELTEFKNVVHVNAADNHLPLESFSHFPCLEGLEAPLNGVVGVVLGEGDFPLLTTLDLSYNTLSGSAVIDLGCLPALRELHLTGNNLVVLPVDMTRPYCNSDGNYAMRYPALERLWLDDNKLADQSTFAILAGLRRLKYLNLDNNELYSIPQLKLLGSNRPQTLTPLPDIQQHTPTTNERNTTLSNHEIPSQSSEVGNMTEQELEEPQSTDEVRELVSEEKHTIEKLNDKDLTNSSEKDVEKAGSVEGDMARASTDEAMKQLSDEGFTSKTDLDMLDVAPFPELDTLSLVNNLILSAEGVLACESWPVLKKLIIYDNPFAAAHKGLSPLLQVRLVIYCGINVIRKKPSSDCKHLIGSKAKEFKKVSSRGPLPIPKCPLPAIESAPVDIKAISYTPSANGTAPSSIRSFSPESNSSLGSVLDSEESEQQSVFMTQVSGEEPDSALSKSSQHDLDPRIKKVEPSTQPVKEVDLISEGLDLTVSKASDGVTTTGHTMTVDEEFAARLREVEERFKDAPAKFKGYELLLDGPDDPYYQAPKDVHGCLRALKHLLKHPLTITDTTRAPPTTLTSSLATTSQFKGNYLKKKLPVLDPLPPSTAQRKVKEVQAVLEDIKSQSTTVETNLSLTLKPTPPTKKKKKKKSIDELHKESKKLLSDLQACYDKVRASSLRSAVEEIKKEEQHRESAVRRVHFSEGSNQTPTSSKHSAKTSRTSPRKSAL